MAEKICPLCHKVCKSLNMHLKASHPDAQVNPAPPSANPESGGGARFEKLFAELESKLEAKQNQRIADLATNLVERVEQVQLKLNESTRATEDRLTNQLQEGLKGLEQRIGERVTTASQQSAKQAVDQFAEQVKARSPKVPENPEAPPADGQSPLATALARFLNVGSHLLESATLGDVVQIFRPPPTPEMQAGQLLGMSLRLADKINKLQSGQGTIGDLTQSITEALTPAKK